MPNILSLHKNSSIRIFLHLKAAKKTVYFDNRKVSIRMSHLKLLTLPDADQDGGRELPAAPAVPGVLPCMVPVTAGGVADRRHGGAVRGGVQTGARHSQANELR